MKQEKKPTVWLDIEADFKPWQKNAYGLLGGLKKGQMFVMSSGRRTGKSMMTAMYMAAHGKGGVSVFGSPWDEWEDTFVWPWNRKTSIESKKKIWGRVKVRYNKIVWEANGKQKQYATKKEVFQRKLRGTD